MCNDDLPNLNKRQYRGNEKEIKYGVQGRNKSKIKTSLKPLYLTHFLHFIYGGLAHKP